MESHVNDDEVSETVRSGEIVPSDGVEELKRRAADAAHAVREGRFQRWLSLVAGVASAVSGLEVAYEHYRGGYSRRVMYTPVALSAALAVAGCAGFVSGRAARTVLPIVSLITAVDCALGFYFHVRGIGRKPGGWRLPVTNIIMGPPIFAPLLFGVSAYLGLIASQLRRHETTDRRIPGPGHAEHLLTALVPHEVIDWSQDVREGRFQRQLALATMLAAGMSGFEAWYSHYKGNFRYASQWTPVVVAPLLVLAGAGATVRPRTAHTWLPVMSAVALIDGSAGFYFHVRGVLRRPGGTTKLFYNVIYGPPIFAPLLFAASGFLGILASLLRREAP